MENLTVLKIMHKITINTILIIIFVIELKMSSGLKSELFSLFLSKRVKFITFFSLFYKMKHSSIFPFLEPFYFFSKLTGLIQFSIAGQFPKCIFFLSFLIEFYF